ncbi:MAG TPA: HipA family kinase [Candidatus Rubrimentiphilum sp.]|nr:HipA family kinase [Candidatus Rubrimentiphilum sp.]
MKHVIASNVRRAHLGGTQPKWFVDADNKVYVVKAPADPAGAAHGGTNSKELFNELFACALADRIGLRVPEHALVEISDNANAGLPRGRHFGSVFLADYRPLPDGSHIVSTLDDYDARDLYLLLAFDELLRNPDRKAGDILVPDSANVSRPVKFLAIDHANAFTGSHWDAAHVAANRTGNSGYNDPWLFWGLSNTKLAMQAAERVSKSSSEFAAIVADVAACSGVDAAEQRAIADFLKARAHNLERWTLKALEIARKD